MIESVRIELIVGESERAHLFLATACQRRDVGEAIPVGSLRPLRTARETLGGRTLERPSCGGFMPTAETTLIPAHGPKISLTSNARLDNEPILAGLQINEGAEPVGPAPQHW